MRDIEIYTITVVGEVRGADAGLFSNAYRTREAAVKFLKEERFKEHKSGWYGTVYASEQYGDLYVKITKITLMRD